MNPNRRHFLRDRTWGAHQALDAAVGALSSPSEYRRYLRGLHAFRAPIEREIERRDRPAALSDFMPSALRHLLRQDMRDLGCAPDPSVMVSLTSNDTASLLGVLYVLEGSALGARLLRVRARHLGFDETFGARHLAYQTASMDNWRRYLALLEGIDGVEPEELVRSAHAAFGAAAQAFGRLSDGT